MMASSAAAAGITTLGNCTDSLPETDIRMLLEWIDSVPAVVSRPKKTIARDFSDGVFIAEIIGYYAPKIIEVHNYSPANAVDKKKANWDTINRKVFPKLKLKLSDSCLKEITELKPGVVEMVLWAIRRKIIEVFPSSVQKITPSSASSVQGTTYSSLARSRSTRTRCKSTSSATSSSRARSPNILPTNSATGKSSRPIPVSDEKLPSILEADDQTEDSSITNLPFSTTDFAEGSTAEISKEAESQADSCIESIVFERDSGVGSNIPYWNEPRAFSMLKQGSLLLPPTGVTNTLCISPKNCIFINKCFELTTNMKYWFFK